jgi:tetratricopeptide (TPR) repeat protein
MSKTGVETSFSRTAGILRYARDDSLDMGRKLVRMVDIIIEYAFYLLFFLVPLILTPVNYELFEYNKMMVTYGITVIIAAAWVIKMILQGRILLCRTPLDIPILLFFASQVISTIFSMDRHTSIWGYYTRSHGGLLSTISYLTLYYAFVTNVSREKIRRLLTVILFTGTLVSIYGVLEHFGIDKDIWVQDVQARVFSTLGQPNWLAAYLAVLIPIAIGMGFTYLIPFLNFNFKFFISTTLAALFYLTLLYTRSRSGFLGVWASLGILVILFMFFRFSRTGSKASSSNSAGILRYAQDDSFITSSRSLKTILAIICFFLIISFVNGIPFLEFNKYLLPGIMNKNSVQNEPQPKGAALDTGVTESGEIRRIVWKGAIDIIKHYPLFGTGTETFAYAYYQYRPAAHNITSEWDFLYNKAHNEYLNFGANNGLFGLGTYLLLIGSFIVGNLKPLIKSRPELDSGSIRIDPSFRWDDKSKSQRQAQLDAYRENNYQLSIINYSLFAGWLSILITNFFGFSVVIIGLFFFLIPAMSFVLSDSLNNKEWVISFINKGVSKKGAYNQLSPGQIILVFSYFILNTYFLILLARFWLADKNYTTGYNYNHAGQATRAFESLKNAVQLNSREPVYRDELAQNLASLAVLANNQNEATLAASLTEGAIDEINRVLSGSPNNLNYYKSQTKIYYSLSQINPEYNQDALVSIQKAVSLAPTDAKIRYNLALLYGRNDENQKAIDTLLETIKLKPNYRDAYYALALYYKEMGQIDKAIENIRFILQNIDPNDKESQTKLSEWTGVEGIGRGKEKSLGGEAIPPLR